MELSTGVNRIYIQLMFSILLPIACIVIFFVSGSIVYRNDEYRKSFYLTTSFLYSLMYFQPQIFKNAISLISCREIGKISPINQLCLILLFFCRQTELHSLQCNIWVLHERIHPMVITICPPSDIDNGCSNPSWISHLDLQQEK